jgi:hypothetical protein
VRIDWRELGRKLWIWLVEHKLLLRKTGAVVAFLLLAWLGAVIYRPTHMAHPLAGPSSLPSWILTAYGPMHVENDYLPGVVDCELGWVGTRSAALEAQAIAARTYLATFLNNRGLTAEVPIGPHFQCWRRARNDRSTAAVKATSGAVLRVGGRLIYANYASGANRLDGRCRPPPPREFGYPYKSWREMRLAFDRGARFAGYAWTEILITHNRGRKRDVRRSPMARNDDLNRGALGQYAAVCLAETEELDTVAILRHFYGSDVELWTGKTRLR